MCQMHRPRQTMDLIETLSEYLKETTTFYITYNDMFKVLQVRTQNNKMPNKGWWVALVDISQSSDGFLTVTNHITGTDRLLVNLDDPNCIQMVEEKIQIEHSAYASGYYPHCWRKP